MPWWVLALPVHCCHTLFCCCLLVQALRAVALGAQGGWARDVDVMCAGINAPLPHLHISCWGAGCADGWP